mgnify:CR=1
LGLRVIGPSRYRYQYPLRSPPEQVGSLPRYFQTTTGSDGRSRRRLV